ncbi:fimbrial protein, partial [Klebsiella pneumoniae]|uniref:fimbrial protein n=1 Tax=Klebsiella pneumoniae TaxID=573 RepID=UPI0037C052EC
MHKINLIAALMLAAAPLAFTGKVTDKTCTISTPGGKDFAVNLPTVSKNTLAAAGNVAGRTPFAINLTKCSAGNVATYFEPGSTVDFNTGRLLNQASANAAT